MPIVRLVWTDIVERLECTRCFEASDIVEALHAVIKLDAEMPVALWIDGKLRAVLTRELHEDGWYWRIG